MGALEAIATWPVGHAGGGTTDAAATRDTAGATTGAFALASVTKLLTAYAVLIACEERTLDLDQPAGPPGATVRHLLAHASGLGADGDVLCPPGRRRVYSNAGYDLLGAALAESAGIPAGTYVHEAVLQPLGMTATDLGDRSPASGATGSVDDLLAFARELLAPHLLAPATLAAATQVAFPGLDGVLPGFGAMSPCDWGLGFELRGHKAPHWTGARNSPSTFGHFGASGTFLWVDPPARLACVVLTDRPFGGWAASAWPQLSDAVLAEVEAAAW